MKKVKRSDDEDDNIKNANKKLKYKDLKEFDEIIERHKTDNAEVRQLNHHFYDKFLKNQQIRGKIFQKRGNEESDEILSELIPQYRKKGYKIPKFTFKKNSIFKETGLLMQPNHIEKYIRLNGLSDFFYKDDKYLSKIEESVMEKVSQEENKKMRKLEKEEYYNDFETETGVPNSEGYDLITNFSPETKFLAPVPKTTDQELLQIIKINEEYINQVRKSIEYGKKIEIAFDSKYEKFLKVCQETQNNINTQYSTYISNANNTTVKNEKRSNSYSNFYVDRNSSINVVQNQQQVKSRFCCLMNKTNNIQLSKPKKSCLSLFPKIQVKTKPENEIEQKITSERENIFDFTKRTSKTNSLKGILKNQDDKIKTKTILHTNVIKEENDISKENNVNKDNIENSNSLTFNKLKPRNITLVEVETKESGQVPPTILSKASSNKATFNKKFNRRCSIINEHQSESDRISRIKEKKESFIDYCYDKFNYKETTEEAREEAKEYILKYHRSISNKKQLENELSKLEAKDVMNSINEVKTRTEEFNIHQVYKNYASNYGNKYGAFELENILLKKSE